MASVVRRDVIVIGGGWSGLMTCKYMLEEGFSVVVLEKRNEIGGVWCYSDDPDILTVMKIDGKFSCPSKLKNLTG